MQWTFLSRNQLEPQCKISKTHLKANSKMKISMVLLALSAALATALPTPTPGMFFSLHHPCIAGTD